MYESDRLHLTGHLRRIAPWFLIAIFAAAVGWPDAFRRYDPGSGRGALLAADPAHESDEEENHSAASDERQLLNQYIYRASRDQRLVLERGLRAIGSGELVEGLSGLQKLFDQPQDGFVWLEADTRPASVRVEAMRTLSGQPAAILRTYERIYGPDARRLLSEARKQRDPALFADIARRYYHTQAGFEAVDWQATRWLDQGRYGLAARLWSRLLADPAHQSRVTPMVLTKAALALRLNGDREEEEALLTRLEGRNIRLAGGAVRLDELAARAVPASSRKAEAAEWPVLLGGPRRSHSAAATGPHHRPAWKLPLLEQRHEWLSESLDRWENQQLSNLQPAAVANFPIAVRNLVIVRSFEGLVALNLETGRVVWKHRPETTLAAAAKEIESNAGRNPGLVSQLDLQSLLAGNASLGALASDGERVYAIDQMDLTSPRSRSRHNEVFIQGNVPAENGSPETNRLIALKVVPDKIGQMGEQEPVWSVGGRPEEDGDRPLAGHFFLGPPLPIDGRLYAVTEADRQLNLVALQPETGGLLWSQGIALVDRPIGEDRGRFAAACSLAYADGVLICPTQLGLLVAVDAVTGTLLWPYYCGDQQTKQRFTRWTPNSQNLHGHPGFPDAPQIAANRVVCLPRQSKSVHCVDLFTGERQWVADRKDAEYIGTVTDELVLVVGRRHCRALSLKDGTELWSRMLGTPSGHGLRVGSKYLVPLQDGRIATLDLSSGNEVGFSLFANGPEAPRVASASMTGTALLGGWESSPKPGNLIAAGNLILSVGPRSLTAYPQAGPLLERVRRDLRGGADSLENRLLAAELELTLGHFDAARSELTAAFRRSPAREALRQAEDLMREILYLELQTGRGDERKILNELDQFAREPVERGRYLIQRTEFELRDGDVEGVLRSAREFAELDLSEPLPLAGNPQHLVSAASWVPAVLGRLRARYGEDELAAVHEQIDIEQQQVLASDSVHRLQQFLDRYARWPQAGAVRSQLARRLIEWGRFQQAELLLLENRESDDPQVAAVATHRLAALWDHLGLYQEAALLLAELEEKYPHVPLEDGTTGRDFIAGLPRDGMLAAAVRQFRGPDWKVARASITEQRWVRNDPKTAEAHVRFRRRFATPNNSTFQLLDRGLSTEGKLAVIDRQSGLITGHIKIPMRNSYPSVVRGAHVGHFFPLGSAGTMHGVSLIERHDEEPLWTTAPSGLNDLQEILRVGPAGPSFCTFQGRQHLMVADPGTGRVLWQRSDLDPSWGLVNDPYAGLIGDDEVLVLFASDRVSYTVYRTATGEELRQGRLDMDVGQQRRVFGRRLFYISREAAESRMRIWDPLEDRIVFDQPVSGRVYSTVTPDDELVVVLPSNRVQIIDVYSGEVRLDLELTAADLAGLNYLRAFRDRDRYYLNFQRNVQFTRAGTYSTYGDTVLPSVQVQGDLYAVDGDSGKLLWKRTLPQRSILQTPHARLPFLVAVSSVRDFNGTRQRLLVELIDGETGEPLALKENIFPDRLLHMACEPEKGRIELHGQHTLIRLDFGPDRQHRMLQDGPL